MHLDFSLTMSSSSPVTGIGSYFEVGFLSSSPPIGFSTAPHAKQTHWKQTLFPLHKNKENPKMNMKGDIVSGMMKIKENERNRRDLDITLEYSGQMYEFKLR